MFGLSKTRSNKTLSGLKKRNARRGNFRLESLEDRQMMTITSIAVDSAGLLSIRGDDLSDNITISQSGTAVTVNSVNPNGSSEMWFWNSGVKSLSIRTNGGADIVTNNTNLHALIYGGLGDDKLTGGSNYDTIYGEGGRDTLRGNRGDDWLYGGTENDIIYGNAGVDHISGDDGDDTLYGGGGGDYISGGIGNDWIAGDDAAGATTVDGVLAGNDIIHGNAGNDTIRGDFGDDQLYGDADNDYLDGGSGNDRMFGGDGNDSLYGQAGNDFLDTGSPTGEYKDGGADMDFDAYKTVVNGASPLDLSQTGSNCFILSAMGAAAKSGVDMASRITYIGNSTYNVSLFHPNRSVGYTPTTVTVSFDGTLKMGDPDPQYRSQEGESWTVIMNRAIAQVLNYDLSSSAGGYTGDALGVILGRTPGGPSWTDYAPGLSPGGDPILNYLYQVQGAPVVVNTRATDALVGNSLLVAGHSYVLQGVYISGYSYIGYQIVPQYTVLLVNPWGVDNNNGMTSGDNDGVVAISGQQFHNSFTDIVLA